MKRTRFALVAFVLALPLFAAAGTGLTIQPVKVSVTLSPGESADGIILLTNASDDAVQVDTSIQDFVPLAGADTIQFIGRAPGVTTVRDWVSLDVPTTSHLGKDQKIEVHYTVHAPANAEPGSHFGVAFFKAIPGGGSGSLRVGTQVGVLFFVTIPGNHLQKGRILDFSAPSFVQTGPVPFIMNFENTGTVHFEPKGTITIRNMFGQVAGIVPIEGQVVLPTGVKKMQFDWHPSGLILGGYTASASVVDGEGNQLTSSAVSFYAAPLWYIGAFALVFILIYLSVRFLRRRVSFSVSLRKP
jgi:hypothetical protein